MGEPIASDTANLLPPKRAAEKLGVSEITLRVWRGRKGGPPFYKKFGRYYYSLDDIAAWVRAGRTEP